MLWSIHFRNSKAWLNLRKVNPNGDGLPHWPVYDHKMRRVLELGATIAPREILKPKILEFYNRRFTERIEQ